MSVYYDIYATYDGKLFPLYVKGKKEFRVAPISSGQSRIGSCIRDMHDECLADSIKFSDLPEDLKKLYGEGDHNWYTCYRFTPASLASYSKRTDCEGWVDTYDLQNSLRDKCEPHNFYEDSEEVTESVRAHSVYCHWQSEDGNYKTANDIYEDYRTACNILFWNTDIYNMDNVVLYCVGG